MNSGTGEEAVEQRNKKYARLLTKVTNFSSRTNLGVIGINTAEALLKIYAAAEIAHKVEILSTIQSSLSPAMEVFDNELIQNPLIPIALLREVIQFYDASSLTHDYLAKVGITDTSNFD